MAVLCQMMKYHDEIFPNSSDDLCRIHSTLQWCSVFEFTANVHFPIFSHSEYRTWFIVVDDDPAIAGVICNGARGRKGDKTLRG